MLVLGHRLVPSVGCQNNVAILHFPSCTLIAPASNTSLLPGMSLREHCNRFLSGSRGRLLDARGGLILRSSHLVRLPLVVAVFRLLSVDVSRRLAGVDPLCHRRHHRGLAAVDVMRTVGSAIPPYSSHSRQPASSTVTSVCHFAGSSMFVYGRHESRLCCTTSTGILMPAKPWVVNAPPATDIRITPANPSCNAAPACAADHEPLLIPSS